MNHASLFTGIGGFDLAAHWMGWTNVFQVEIDPFCQKVLTKNFPNVTRYGDIKTFTGEEYAGTIDVLSGGFPCQPFSIAGKRQGTEDERNLWPEMCRVIRAIQPPVVVGENVRGLLNWNGGMVFESVQADLEDCGYTVTPFVLPAAGKNAPHRRDRVWFVAYSDRRATAKAKPREQWLRNAAVRNGTAGPSADATGFGLERITNNDGNIGETTGTRPGGWLGRTPSQDTSDGWRAFPSEPPICRTDDGVSHRLDRLRSLGNAIVPQVALEIFRAIQSTCVG